MTIGEKALDFSDRSIVDDRRPYLRILRGLVFLVAFSVWANPACAQSGYPTRPIQLVVTVPPGGAADFVARMVGAKLADAVGQPVIIVNRGGAAGTTAAASVAKSDPD